MSERTVVAVLERLGKVAVVVGDGPGFVANRIQFALFKEATQIVEDGLATPEQVDEVVRSSFGFRLPFFGPFAIADLAGLDVYADIYDTLERGLGDAFSTPALLREHVDRGEFGVKTGRGFLRLSPENAKALIERRDQRLRQARRAPRGAGDMSVLPTQRLDGQHAIVTGAGRGIGRAAALALAEAGADVTLFARTESRAPSRSPSEVHRGADDAPSFCVEVTVRSPDDVERLVEASAAHGVPSICVTAAGPEPPRGRRSTSRQPTSTSVVDTNLRGTYLTCRAFAARVTAAGSGRRIVAISSQMGEVGYPGRAAYCASKRT